MTFPPKDEIAQKDLLQFIQTASFQDNWKALKKLYKQLEINPISKLMVAMIYRIDRAQKSDCGGQFPSWKTVTYMKRRAARFLQQIAQNDEQLYIKMCKDLMLLQKEEVNFEIQWILFQILLGNSKRFEQKRHGRGKIIELEGKPNIIRSEEKCVELWDKYLAVLELVLNENGLAVPVYEFCTKVFLRNNRALPVFEEAMLEQFFDSDSPFLQYIAVQQGFQLFEKEDLRSKVLFAKLFFFSTSGRQRRILKTLKAADDSEKNQDRFIDKISSFFVKAVEGQKADIQLFINSLADVAFDHLEQRKSISGRIKRSITYLIEHKNLIEPKTILRNAKAILLTKETEWLNLIYHAIKELGFKYTEQWLEAFTDIDSEIKESIFQKLLNNYQNHSEKKLELLIREQLTMHDSFLIADFAWFILKERDRVRNQAINSIFWNIQWRGMKAPAFRHMIQSEYAAQILLEDCHWYLERTLFLDRKLVYIINNGSKTLKEAAISALLKKAKSNFFKMLPIIGYMKEMREALLESLETSISKQQVLPNFLFDCLKHNNSWVSETAWRMLENYPPNDTVIRGLFLWTFYNLRNDKIESFIERLSSIKNTLFQKNLTLALKNIFQNQPRFINRIAKYLDKVMQLLEIEVVVGAVEAVDDQNWELVKPSIETFLQSPSGTAFWLKLLQILPDAEDDEKLAKRFLNDPTLSQTFFKITSPEVLDCHHPAFETLLAEWLQLNENIFDPNSPNLFKAATHRFPKIRDWALARAQQEGMDLSFAMQLIESGLPETMVRGKSFFEKVEAGTTDELENLLALCDSPNPEVRRYGLQYFQNRKPNFDNALALECLSEHTDPVIQEFVAEKLKANKIKQNFSRNFDRSVLRTKNQSRKAKELIKNRIESDLDVHPDTLLELARGHNQRDKEWALEQLMKLVLKGEEVPEVLVG